MKQHNISKNCFYKQCQLLIALVLVLPCYMLNAQAVDFSPSGFTVVRGNQSSYQYLEAPDGFHRYRLTAAQQNESTALWSHTKIDLTKSFVADLRLNFGENNNGADGFVFVLQQLGYNVIGGSGQGIGYANLRARNTFNGILPDDEDYALFIDSNSIDTSYYYSSSILSNNSQWASFGIEFDSFNNNTNAIGDINDRHISYLRNGSMRAIDDLCMPAQDNTERIKRNHFFCVRIKWKVNPNGGYDLTTYFSEWAGTRELKERHTMHFAEISDLFPGVSASNPLVIWGVTSGTGGSANIQMVVFISIIHPSRKSNL